MNEKLKKHKFVEELELFKKVGDTLFIPPEGYEYLGWLMVSGGNLLDAQENLAEALTHIKYDVSKFHKDSTIGMTARRKSLKVTLGKNILMQRRKLERLRKLSESSMKSLHIGIAMNVIDDSNTVFKIKLAKGGGAAISLRQASKAEVKKLQTY